MCKIVEIDCTEREQAEDDQETDHPTFYDGELRDRKIIFAILTHKDVHVLAAQIKNIRHFNPKAGIIIYNGGQDKDFAKNLNVPICPYSRPIRWGYLPYFLWDVMVWLEESNVQYEYLVNLDHDVLFIKRGFRKYLDQIMNGYDYMGWDMRESTKPIPKRGDGAVAVPAMRKKWDKWYRIFNTDHFLWSFNPGQVFRKNTVTKMVTSVDSSVIVDMFEHEPVRALEEMFFVTLAKASGARCRKYPIDRLAVNVVRWGKNITPNAVQKAIKHPNYYWIHPIKGRDLIKMNDLLLKNKSKKSNRNTL